MDKILEIEKLCFSYGENPIIAGFDLTLGRGERLCLAAPSGKGKTTLLRLIAGLERPESGSIRVGGRLAYLFQEDRLLGWRTIGKNLTLAADRSLSEPVRRERATSALEAVGLSGCADKYPRELSGGMKRRAAIARTLCYGGELLLLDEPFTGLDRDSRELCARALLSYFPDAAMLLISHIPEDAGLLGADIRETDFGVRNS